MAIAVCVNCGSEFRSYNPSPRFCSRRCKGDHQTSAVDVDRGAELYGEGKTQDEIALELGVTQKIVFNAMKRHNIPARTAAKRDQWGENNHMWKGDDASKSAFHIRLYKRHGQLNHCDVCGTNDPAHWYDWANLTGHYEDITDYKRMCRSCHRQYDAARRKGGDAQ